MVGSTYTLHPSCFYLLCIIHVKGAELLFLLLYTPSDNKTLELKYSARCNIISSKNIVFEPTQVIEDVNGCYVYSIRLATKPSVSLTL